ncbi:MAG: thioesterase [Desulfobacteraceae bacterium]|nr:thioesterase [Desulfobacteraceae bacterium]
MRSLNLNSKINTHKLISSKLCGTPVFIDTNSAQVKLELIPEMAADEKGLIHGGFIFGLADYAAMICVNDPLVVLASSSSRFLKPLKTGETAFAYAQISGKEKNKVFVNVDVYCEEDLVFKGEFTAVIPKKHVLDN